MIFSNNNNSKTLTDIGSICVSDQLLTPQNSHLIIYIALGAVTFAIAFKILKTKTPIHGRLSLREKLRKLDLLGGFLLIAGLVSLFFALQWGGSRYPWSDPRVYACVVVFGVLISVFVVLQAMKKEE